jgi:hypothetical protein
MVGVLGRKFGLSWLYMKVLVWFTESNRFANKNERRIY